MKIAIQKIHPDPDQPRKDPGDVEDLKASFSKLGQIQPITVREDGDHYYVVVGERRLSAARALGWRYVDCILSSNHVREKQLAENMIRRDLSPLEISRALDYYKKEHDLTNEKTASAFGFSERKVRTYLGLLKLAPSVQKMIDGGKITIRAADTLVAVPVEKQEEMAQEAASEKINTHVDGDTNLRRGLKLERLIYEVRDMLDGFDGYPRHQQDAILVGVSSLKDTIHHLENSMVGKEVIDV